MKNKSRWIFAALLMSLLVGFLSPGLPWSARCHHILNRLMTKAEMKAYAWHGVSSKLISFSGKIVGRDQPLKGAEIEALDSTSGWAATANEKGEFVLPDVMWYPGAQYVLLVKANEYQERALRLQAPTSYPENGIQNVGELRFDLGSKIDRDTPGQNSVSHIEYDRNNAAYYKELFGTLTASKHTDEEKLAVATRYVAGKLISNAIAGHSESPRHLNDESPRQILESGSRYCGKLSLALATIARAGNYKARLVNVVDSMIQPSAHMVTEIYYDEQWHLYDPTSGTGQHDKDGRSVSYKQLCLSVDTLSIDAVPDHLPMTHNSQADWLSKVYRSGFHHYYYFRD
jgi:Transglutaminase-like superfamily